MLRISLLGPENSEFHFKRLLGIGSKEYESHLKSLARALADLGVELALLPEKGVCIELAAEFRKLSPSRLIGIVPQSGNEYSIFHPKPYIEKRVNGKRLFDGFIKVDDWYRRGHLHPLFGDIALVLGTSLGSMAELCCGLSMYKLIKGAKKTVTSQAKRIHPELNAGRMVRFSVFVYQPFVEEKLPTEIEAYARKLGIDIIYARTPGELKREIQRLVVRQ